MRHVIQRDGIWWVRINIPADLQARWGKTAEWRSLRTSNEREALTLAPPIIVEIKDRIDAMRGNEVDPAPHVAVAEQIVRLMPEHAFSLIERWRNNQLEAAYVSAYNGELQAIVGDEKVQRSETLYALAQPSPWNKIAEFNVRHACVLGVPIDHPAIRHSRVLFAEAWLDVENQIDRFRFGDFSRWEPQIAVEAAPPATATNNASLKLSALLERFIPGSTRNVSVWPARILPTLEPSIQTL